MRKRYLFFDIDGTLLAGGYENSYIPLSTKEALCRLRDQGHFLAIATGRSHAMAKETMHALGFENMVSDGGHGITVENRLLGIKPLRKEEVLTLLRECDEQKLPWSLQLDDSDTRVTPDERFPDAIHDDYMKTVVTPDLRPEETENIYKVYVACQSPQEQALASLSSLPWCRYQKDCLFVEPACKGEGIKAIMDYFHADYRDVVVFGDSKNDLSMFLDEWTKVAMGNASPELKAKADYITSDVDKDGIYHACAALGLF